MIFSPVATAIGTALLIAGRVLAYTVLVWISAVFLAGGLILDLRRKQTLPAATLVRIKETE